MEDKLREAFAQAKKLGLLSDGSVSVWEEYLRLADQEMAKSKKQIQVLADQINRIHGKIESIGLYRALAIEAINRSVAFEIRNKNILEAMKDPLKTAQIGKETIRPVEPIAEGEKEAELPFMVSEQPSPNQKATSVEVTFNEPMPPEMAEEMKIEEPDDSKKRKRRRD